MKPSVIFLSLFASCLLMGQELETYSGQYILRSGEIPFVCPDGRRHEITYHYIIRVPMADGYGTANANIRTEHRQCREILQTA